MNFVQSIIFKSLESGEKTFPIASCCPNSNSPKGAEEKFIHQSTETLGTLLVLIKPLEELV